MLLTIAKRFTFDAAHWLPHVPDGHKCRRWHGHTYSVEVVCSGPLDERGMIVDYAEIEEAWAPLHHALDHRILNEVAGLENPTTEVLAPWILERLKGGPLAQVLRAVRVWESSTTWCEARSVDDHEAGYRSARDCGLWEAK